MADQAGSDPAGIGIPGLAATPSFRVTAFSTARSAGDFIPHLQSIGPPSFMEATGVARIRSAKFTIPMGMAWNRTADSAVLWAGSMEADLVAEVEDSAAAAANADRR